MLLAKFSTETAPVYCVHTTIAWLDSVDMFACLLIFFKIWGISVAQQYTILSISNGIMEKKNIF